MAKPSRPRGRPAPNLGSGRDRVLSAAYDLFSRRGVRAVGVDDIIAAAGVAKATFYRNYPKKELLIQGFMKLREQRWTRDWLEAEVLKRETAPRRRLLAVFDVFGEWFGRKDFEGCPFVGTVAQAAAPRDRVRAEAVAQLGLIRAFIAQLARDAGIQDPDDFAQSFQLLMQGSIVKAMEGDRAAAKRARRMAELLIEAR